ncbi:WW domain-containing protein [Lachnellula willkommii]|uniref:WW domain-containing protein n=1 Tax=Lachnellula willkommii TaxID=215461 RepID=A0A559LZQ6_9HELO|nr:WW domain-containing protein [Lachnellula willkommii]
MSDFAPPAGPPPPTVPAGYKAVWNDQYKEWFYVNIYTKQSQWNKPTEPVYPAGDGAPAGPPPGYAGGSMGSMNDTKSNPYDTKPGGSHVESDAELAARLQAEENARSSTSRNAQQDYQNTSMSPSPSYQQDLPAREQKKSGGFLGKLLGKASGGSSSHQQGGYGGNQYPQQYPQHQQYPQQGYQQQGYPPQGYQQGYQQGPPQGPYGGGYSPYGGGYQQQAAPKKSGGLGMAGGAALGLGGGLVGGMLLEDAIDHGGDGGDGGGDGGGSSNPFLFEAWTMPYSHSYLTNCRILIG